jgi:predicted flap endonuclease-1-like 5' DNA nuclease
METLIYTILATIVIGVILYLIINSKSKNKKVHKRIPNRTLELHINYIEPENKKTVSNTNGVKPEQLIEPRANGKDDLKLIKGIGEVIEGILNDNGIYHFEQISNWTDENIEWMNSNVIYFPKKIVREDWRGQAKKLK